MRYRVHRKIEFRKNIKILILNTNIRKFKGLMDKKRGFFKSRIKTNFKDISIFNFVCDSFLFKFNEELKANHINESLTKQAFTKLPFLLNAANAYRKN